MTLVPDFDLHLTFSLINLSYSERPDYELRAVKHALEYGIETVPDKSLFEKSGIPCAQAYACGLIPHSHGPSGRVSFGLFCRIVHPLLDLLPPGKLYPERLPNPGKYIDIYTEENVDVFVALSPWIEAEVTLESLDSLVCLPNFDRFVDAVIKYPHKVKVPRKIPIQNDILCRGNIIEFLKKIRPKPKDHNAIILGAFLEKVPCEAITSYFTETFGTGPHAIRAALENSSLGDVPTKTFQRHVLRDLSFRKTFFSADLRHNKPLCTVAMLCVAPSFGKKAELEYFRKNHRLPLLHYRDNYPWWWTMYYTGPIRHICEVAVALINNETSLFSHFPPMEPEHFGMLRKAIILACKYQSGPLYFAPRVELPPGKYPPFRSRVQYLDIVVTRAD